MQFLVKAFDGDGMLAKRMEVRPEHLRGMEELGAHVVCAGGMLSEDGVMIGSVLVLDFPDRSALDEYLAREPYVREHVWEKIDVEIMNVVILDGKRVS